jgi:hypothetical protein
MSRLARLLAFEEHNIHVELDGERLVVDGPANIVTDELVAELRLRKPEIIRALRGWRVTYVTVEVTHGRLWLSTVERAYGIPLAPGERIAPAAVGAAIAWLFEPERQY